MITDSCFGSGKGGVETALWELPSLRREWKQIISQIQGGYSNPTGLYFEPTSHFLFHLDLK